MIMKLSYWLYRCIERYIIHYWMRGAAQQYIVLQISAILLLYYYIDHITHELRKAFMFDTRLSLLNA